MKTYPTRSDKFWMKPGGDLCTLIGPYSLLAVNSYGRCKQEATYQCMCLRCGSLHEIRRVQLQAMARAQKRAHQPLRQLHGSCPNCKDTDPPSVTVREYIFQKLMANGLQVLHVVVHQSGGAMARVRICDGKGKVATAEIKQTQGGTTNVRVELDGAGTARWLINADRMLDMLIAKLEQDGIRTISYDDAGFPESLFLRA